MIWRYDLPPTKLSGHNAKITLLYSFMRDGIVYLISTGLDNKLILWDVLAGTIVGQVGVTEVKKIEYLPSLGYIIALSPQLTVYDMFLNTRQKYGEDVEITCMTVDRKRNILYTGYANGTVKVDIYING